MSRRFDAIVIGAGQAGPPLAVRLAEAGMEVALIERHLFGGTCVNSGCMPTKTLVASARAAHVARNAAKWGVDIAGPVTVDMKRVKARADKVILDARSGVEKWLAGTECCTVIRGQAAFESADTIRVGDELLTAPKIFINVGGRANVPDMPGVHDVPYLVNTTMLQLDHVPKHLIVVGGSYIGLEFAQAFRRFGAEVTVVEMGPRLVGREDEDVSEAIRAVLEAEGIAVRTGAECISLAPHPEGVAIHVECTEGPPDLCGSHLLLAVGRKPNTGDLGLDKAGVAVDARGYIPVDDQLCTNIEGIWALGDCNGRGAFTHTSYNDYEIVAANLIDGEQRGLRQRVPGYGLFIDPPLGRAGITEIEARKSGRPILVGKRAMTRVGRAKEMGETQGLMKIVVDAETNKILGAAILGPGGDEAIHGVLDVMTNGGDASALRWSVPVHPTVAELWPTLLVEAK